MAKRRTAGEVVNGSDNDSANDSVRRVSVELPLGGFPEQGYEHDEAESGRLLIKTDGLHLNVQLGREAAEAFLRMRNGLRETTARMDDGRPVWSNADALRWLMGQVAQAPL